MANLKLKDKTLKLTVPLRKPISPPLIEPLRYCLKPKVVTLTFDDGPDASITQKVVEMCKKLKIPATFFQVGDNIDRYPLISRYIHDNRFVIAGHSKSHASANNTAPEQLTKDIESGAQSILNAIGKQSVYYRPPYGDYTNDSMAVWNNLGYLAIKWSVDTKDWSSDSTNITVIEHIKDKLLLDSNNGHILLCHDSHHSCFAALSEIKSTFISYGYRFVTMEECIGVSPYA